MQVCFETIHSKEYFEETQPTIYLINLMNKKFHSFRNQWRSLLLLQRICDWKRRPNRRHSKEDRLERLLHRGRHRRGDLQLGSGKEEKT